MKFITINKFLGKVMGNKCIKSCCQAAEVTNELNSEKLHKEKEAILQFEKIQLN